MINETSIHQLALFICHLFIDGHFRTAHFLYNPNAFESSLMVEIDVLCPKPIPSYLTDITVPWEWPWNDKDSPNNVLQLNFFDLAEDVEQLQSDFAYYSVFCFQSTDLINAKQLTSIFETLRSQAYDSKILLVHYNTSNVFTFIDTYFYSNGKSNQQPIIVLNNKTNFKLINLFDQTFGEYERMQSFAIQRVQFGDRSEHGTNTKYETVQPLWIHYYHLQLSNSFINITWIDTLDDTYILTNKHCVLQSSNYYKELSLEYQCHANGNLSSNDRSICLHVEPFGYFIQRFQYEYKASTYPFRSIKLRAIFVYGTDYKREIDIFRITGSVRIVAALILSLLFAATLILYMIRRQYRLPGNNIGSVIVDCLIPFIGGGNLRMEHRFERWFFGILLIGAFLIVSVFGGDLVDSIIYVLNSKIKTFDDVAKIDPMIYLDGAFNVDGINIEILQMLITKLQTNLDNFDWMPHEMDSVKLSYLVIPAEDAFDFVLHVLDYYKRDYDILEEPLGEISDQFFLTSNQYISARMMAKIDKMTNSLAEYGFYQFYGSFLEFQREQFLSKHAPLVENYEINLKSIIIEQLTKPIVIVLCLNGIAIIIFVTEILIFKWLKWRNCRVQILPCVAMRPNHRLQPESVDICSKRYNTGPTETTKIKRKYTKRCSKRRRSCTFLNLF